MILLDSSAWIDYLSGGDKSAGLDKVLGDPEAVLTPTIVLYEVYKKLKRARGEEAALAAAAQLTQTRMVPIDESIALSAADLSLRYDLPMADALVAAAAKAHGAKVLTLDSDFARVPWAKVL